jgi:predicted peptidase
MQITIELPFLHGAGEKGSNLEYVKRHGVARIVEEQPDFPFIAVSPQCPQGQYWSVPRLSTLLDEVESSYRVDPDRIYLTGISMGGFGTWRLAAAQPHRFAAIAPICGGGDPTDACNLKDLPVWAFHGARDCAKRTAQRAIVSFRSVRHKRWSRH